MIRYRPKIAAIVTLLAALAIAGVGIALTLTAPGAEAQSAPGAVNNLTLTRSDGTLTVSWNAVSDATKYHALYQADGAGDWLPPIPDYQNITATSFTFDIDSAKSYVVGVRAGNANGWGAWTDSPTSNPPLPAAVGSITLTRSDGTLTVSWNAVAGAAKYHALYQADGAGDWLPPIPDYQNITATSFTFNIDNNKSYAVGVRAGNSAGWGPWTDSPTSGPYTPPTPTPTPTPTATPTPLPSTVSVSNLDYATGQFCRPSGDRKCAIGFTTGSEANGYTLVSVTSKFYPAADPNDVLGDIVVTLHADNSGVPANAAVATLSGSNPTPNTDPETITDYIYACSGAGCALSPNTTYFAQFTATAGVVGSESYYLATTYSDDQVLVPSGNGWALADDIDIYIGSSWNQYPDAIFLKLSATKRDTPVPTPTPTATPTPTPTATPTPTPTATPTPTPTATPTPTPTATPTPTPTATPTPAPTATPTPTPTATPTPTPTATPIPGTDYDADNDGLIEVSSAAQLSAIRYDADGNGKVSAGNRSSYQAAYPNAASNMGCPTSGCAGYELSSGLNLSGQNWTPLPDYEATFEGNNFTISNLYVDRKGFDSTGLFTNIEKDGVVRNLVLASADVPAAKLDSGILAGVNRGTITNVTTGGTVAGLASSWSTGGLVGFNAEHGTITNSSSSATVDGHFWLGGLVGWNQGAITGSTASGTVTGNKFLGGLAGFSNSSISGSTASGSVTGNADVGGLVGEHQGSITGSSSSGTVTGEKYVGGLAGENDGGAITNSNSTSNVTGFIVGALTGINNGGTITNSSGAGTVTQLPGLASASVTSAGLVSWEYELASDVSFSYVQVRWIEKPTSGTPNWGNATKHIIWDSSASSYQITGLTSGTEYVVRLFFGLSQNGFKMLKVDAGSFTPSG